MKRLYGSILILAYLLAGCNPGDVVNPSEDIIRSYGDDIARNAVKVAEESEVLANSDDVARGVYSTWEEALKNSSGKQDLTEIVAELSPKQGEFLSRGLAAADAPTVIYEDISHFSVTQMNVVQKIMTQKSLDKEQAQLFLQGMCTVWDFITLSHEFPSEDLTAVNMGFLFLVQKSQSKPKDLADWAAKVNEFAFKLASNEKFNSSGEGAKILFDGLCLTVD